MQNFLRLLLVLFIATSIFVARHDLVTVFNRLSLFINPIAEKSRPILPPDEEITLSPDVPKKTVYTPGALKIQKQVNLAPVGMTEELSVQKIIELTNRERVIKNLTTLREDKLLGRSAEIKVDDMLQKQYFAHISPSGKGVSDVALDVDYKYIIIGENLASGDFLDNKQLVDAWMASPGHRANILNPRYQEIGVSVKKGMFDGREVWMAVQHFAMPLSACPAVDSAVKDRIDENKKNINAQGELLETLKQDIESISENDPKYGQEIEKYNTLVEAYNALLNLTKSLVDSYNKSINIFNECLKGS